MPEFVSSPKSGFAISHVPTLNAAGFLRLRDDGLKKIPLSTVANTISSLLHHKAACGCFISLDVFLEVALCFTLARSFFWSAEKHGHNKPQLGHWGIIQSPGFRYQNRNHPM